MQTTPRNTVYQRCPSCGSRVASNASTCSICGHEFETISTDNESTLPTEAVNPDALTVAQTQGRRFSLAKLPWGVIGVAAVILVLALGAVILLRNLGNPSFTPVITTSTPDVTAVAGNSGPTATPTSLNVPTTTPTAILPTSVPVPPTLTPIPPIEYVVQEGDTCGGIADKNSIPLQAFLDLNQLNRDDCLIRVGDKVKLPPPTPTVGPSPTLPPGVTVPPTGSPEPTATLPPLINIVVKGGDTCSDIADKYRVPVQTLVQQNGLDADCTLQIGQVLTLTFATPTPGVTATPIIAQTPTPRSGFDAPSLISPRDGADITETEDVVTLQWLSVSLLKDDEWYIVQVQPSGAITVPIFATKATSIKITRDILGNETERSFAWWVQVKRDLGTDALTGQHAYAPLSPPSAARRFTWRKPQVTPTPQSPY